MMVECNGANAYWHSPMVNMKHCRDSNPTVQRQPAATQHSKPAIQDLIKTRETALQCSHTQNNTGVVYAAFMKDTRTHPEGSRALLSRHWPDACNSKP